VDGILERPYTVLIGNQLCVYWPLKNHVNFTELANGGNLEGSR
jgi:hypothetical protein